MTKPPHIIILHSHDTGRWIQPYGFNVATPALQKLAERGTVFRQAFCAAPTCSPSRAALWTGTAPHCNGMLGLGHRGFSLHDTSWHLAVHAGDHGYQTAAFGQEHITDGQENVWQHRARMSGESALDCAKAGLEWLKGAAANGPCLVSVGLFETHRDFPPGDGSDAGAERYAHVPATLPDNAAVREDMVGYARSAAIMDEAKGHFIEGLTASLGLENTLLICTTDHGPAFPGMKCNLTDAGIGVYLIMAGRGVAQGQVVDEVVSQLDLFPTICEVAGIPKPERLQGSSLVPLLAGDAPEGAAPLHDALYGEVTYHAAYEPQRSIRTQRWKYIRRFNPLDRQITANCDEGPTREWLMERGWAQRPMEEEQLFDLALDPAELENLVNAPEHQATLQELRERLHQWMADTRDPLLDGPVPAPPGAEVDPPN